MDLFPLARLFVLYKSQKWLECNQPRYFPPNSYNLNFEIANLFKIVDREKNYDSKVEK